MLVLSRKRGERIMIGEDICITIVDVDGPKVRVGIVAPRDVEVYRQEIFDERRAARGAGEGRDGDAHTVERTDGRPE